MKPSQHFTDAMNSGGKALQSFMRGVVGLVAVLGTKLTRYAQVVDEQLAKG